MEILVKGHTVQVDDCNADLLIARKWQIREGKHTFYVYRKQGNEPQHLHRIVVERILGYKLEAKMRVDHIDGNGLNNLGSNLRPCSNSENMRNARKHKDSVSQLKGASFDSERNKWVAAICVDGKQKFLGRFLTAAEAHEAYRAAAVHYFGEFARFD